MFDFTNDSLESESQTQQSSQIKDYFKGKTVLLTGGLGFLGQLYVEKMLRSDVKEVYFLARGKKDKSAEQRVQEELFGPHFSKLKEHDPNYAKRIRIILGDLTKKNIGISDTDLNDIYENVNIVLHSAADVRFDEKLINLVLTNLRGTRELLKIAEKIKNFEIFAYISTAYSNCTRAIVREEFYEPPIDSEKIIEFYENLTNEELNEMEILTEVVIKPWPNTYVYTKCLSEDMVRRYSNKFATCVIRPTIIISTHEDPIPGWCNNIYGLNGVLVACGMGLLRVMPFDRTLIGDIICADFVTNSTFVAIWYTHMEQMKLKKNAAIKNENKYVKPEIYFVGSSVDKPLKWKEISDATNRECSRNPPDGALWKQCENDTVCPFLFFYYSIIFQLIPAIISDFVLSFTNKTTRFQPIYRRTQKFLNALKYFMQKEFKFTNKNMRKVLDLMSPADKEFFPCDVKDYDWQVFSYNYVLGLRRYIVKEYPFNPNAHKKYRLYTFLHLFFLGLFYGFHLGILWLCVRKMNLYNSIFNYTVESYQYLIGPN